MSAPRMSTPRSIAASALRLARRVTPATLAGVALRPPRITYHRLRATHPSRTVAGTRFDALQCDEVMHTVLDAVARRRRLRLSFANAEFVIEGEKREWLRRYLDDCDLVLADGNSIVTASRMARPDAALPARVTGTDFVEALGRASAAQGVRLAFVGGAPGVAQGAADRLTARFPGAQVVVCLNGYEELADTERAIARINAATPDVLMVCLGNPRQEAWIERHQDALTVPVIFGNGGALDFAAGRVQRAPYWMQRMGLEWTYRLLQDPSMTRFRRQARLPYFIWLAWRRARTDEASTHGR
jgi:N-acetylglucosaminyldiphosphoundecaprenol N-acetyl-beta-D-mannosaminyltransferase